MAICIQVMIFLVVMPCSHSGGYQHSVGTLKMEIGLLESTRQTGRTHGIKPTYEHDCVEGYISSFPHLLSYLKSVSVSNAEHMLMRQ
jgi:hypothetical protein